MQLHSPGTTARSILVSSPLSRHLADELRLRIAMWRPCVLCWRTRLKQHQLRRTHRSWGQFDSHSQRGFNPALIVGSELSSRFNGFLPAKVETVQTAITYLTHQGVLANSRLN